VKNDFGRNSRAPEEQQREMKKDISIPDGLQRTYPAIKRSGASPFAPEWIEVGGMPVLWWGGRPIQ
jgi:hypothetical protein